MLATRSVIDWCTTMMKNNKAIEIVSSTTAWLSSMGKASREAACKVLAKHYTSVRVTIINNLADLEALVDRRPDLVFLGMDFILSNPDLGLNDPNKIWLAEYLDNHDIAYTGSGRCGHELEHHKHRAKQAILNAGLSTSPFFVAKQNTPQVASDMMLSFPLFIKPTNHGGGSGIDCNSLAHNFDELNSKVQSITANLQSDSLVEEYLPGREFSVAILKSEYSNDYMVMPIELVATPDNNGVRMLSKRVKHDNQEQVSEIADEQIKQKVTTLAINAFKALGARDYGRIDIRLDKHGTPHFLEANLIPSLISGYGSFPKACLINMGLGYEDMMLHITRLGLVRNLDTGEDDAQSILNDAVRLAVVTA